ncbi:MAG: DUF494 family protein [Desulfuromonadales bacterium]|nr:DUF494 family protein [Desulfuromonadales bacterium]
MRERVLAIVNLIAQYFLEDSRFLSEADLVEELLDVGFAADEIDAAFSWMENHTIPVGEAEPLLPPPESHRIFTREEQQVLPVEVCGYLSRLRNLGMIDDDAHEEIVERVIELAEEELTLQDVKQIAVLVLFARSQHDWRCEYDCLLEDDWSPLLN